MCCDLFHLLGGDPRAKYSVRERTTPQRSDEDDGFEQRRALDRLVHHQYRGHAFHCRSTYDCIEGRL